MICGSHVTRQPVAVKREPPEHEAESAAADGVAEGEAPTAKRSKLDVEKDAAIEAVGGEDAALGAKETEVAVASVTEAERPAASAVKSEKKEETYLPPPPEDGVLPFLAIVPNMGKLEKYKRLVSVDKWAFAAWGPLLDWVARDRSVPMSFKRPFFRGVLEIYQTCGRVWKDYCDAEIATGKAELVEEYFTRSLLLCQHVPLWLTYLSYISSKQHVSLITAREEAITAFEFAITHIGLDAESAPIWEMYIAYLRKMSCANVFEESNRMATIRRVYQRAIATPTDGLEQLWKSYQQWEQQVDPKLAQELTQKFGGIYNTARVALRERSGYLKGIRRNQMAVPPTEAGDMAHQVLLWKRLLLFEKSSKTAESDPLTFVKKLRGTFDCCLVVLRYYPEIWLDYANTMLRIIAKQSSQENAIDTVRKIFLLGVEALPGSTLLHFEYSLFLERNLQLADAGAVFDMMMQRDAFSASDKQLATIQQLLFVRRTRGLQEGRRHSVHALKSPHVSWQLCVVAARVELFMNRDTGTARKVFDFGMGLYGSHVPYLLQYITGLYAMNEEANMRVLFDTFMKDDVLRYNRELWDEYLRFEITYGNRVTIDSVARLRAEALGNAVDPNGIFGSLNRFRVLDLFPALPQEIRAMSLGVNVMLKDGSRGDTEDSVGGRALLGSSGKAHLLKLNAGERGNPLKVLFRDPPHLHDLPRPIVSGEGCGLTMYTRELAVGAMMPGQELGAVIPPVLLDVIGMLPASHDYNGPAVDVNELIDILRGIELPGPPEQHMETLPTSSTGPKLEAGLIANAPSAGDIFRLRQTLKRK